MSAESDLETRLLDEMLESDGEDIELRRLVGQQLIPIKVICRALVRRRTNKELVGSIVQDDDWIILSPTQIIAKGWPGPWTPSPTESTQNPDRDYRLPKKGDKAMIDGRARNIEIVKPIYIDNELIRIELQVLG